MKKGWVIVSVTMAMVLWGWTFVIFKYANQSLNPISIIFFRLLISVVFLFIFAKLSGRLMKVKKDDVKWFFLMALFEPFFYFLGESFGLSLISSTLAAVIISTIPLFVPIAAYFFFRERLSMINIAGLLLSFAGVLLVVFSSDTTIAADIKGIGLMFLAVISAVGYTLIAKRLIHTYNGITITAYQSLLGALFFMPLFFLVDLRSLDLRAILPESIWAMLYLGIFGSSIAFILFTIAIRELGASKANVYANLVPVVAAIASFFLLKEAMPALKIMGIVVVLAGLLLTQLRTMKEKNGQRKWKNWFTMPRV